MERIDVLKHTCTGAWKLHTRGLKFLIGLFISLSTKALLRDKNRFILYFLISVVLAWTSSPSRKPTNYYQYWITHEHYSHIPARIKCIQLIFKTREKNKKIKDDEWIDVEEMTIKYSCFIRNTNKLTADLKGLLNSESDIGLYRVKFTMPPRLHSCNKLASSIAWCSPSLIPAEAATIFQ